MEALGNDYIYFDCTKKILDEKTLPKLSRFLSDRHFGIGADGIILISESKFADFKMRILNADGSEAQMCGNGIRCVAKFVYEKALCKKKELSIETLAGIKNLKLDVKDNIVDKITVDMGKPVFDPKIKIEINKKINIEGFDLNCLSFSNPHAVTFVDDLDKIDVIKYGKLIESSKYFSDKTNVEFAKVIDRQNIKVYVYERGSGETMACGTGACAVCVAAILNNFADKNRDINIIFKGGNLSVKWLSDGNVFMTGGANFVFDGEFNYKKFLETHLLK